MSPVDAKQRADVKVGWRVRLLLMAAVPVGALGGAIVGMIPTIVLHTLGKSYSYNDPVAVTLNLIGGFAMLIGMVALPIIVWLFISRRRK